MSHPRLTRIASTKDNLQVALSNHRDQILCILTRYLSQGRTILQPHHLIDQLNIAIEENKDTFIQEGPFAKLIRNSQVDLLKNPKSLTSFCVPNTLKTHFLSISLETFQQFQLQKKFQSF
jgi:hypothetical protein